jgi:MFS family permease
MNPLAGAGMIAAGVGLGCVAFHHARRKRNPLIDVTTLDIPTFKATVVTGTLTRIAIGAVPYLLPLMFQIGFGLSAFKSGLLLIISAVGNLGMKALTTPILRRYGFRRVAIVDCLAGGVFIIACGLLTPESPLMGILFVVFAYGVTRSMQFAMLAMLAYADVPPEQTSAANTLWNAAYQMSIGLGIAFGALALRVAAALNGHDAPGGHGFTLHDFRFAFLCTGGLMIASVYGYIKLARDAGHAVSGASVAAERRKLTT